jgi:hypothetical protein
MSNWLCLRVTETTSEMSKTEKKRRERERDVGQKDCRIVRAGPKRRGNASLEVGQGRMKETMCVANKEKWREGLL